MICRVQFMAHFQILVSIFTLQLEIQMNQISIVSVPSLTVLCLSNQFGIVSVHYLTVLCLSNQFGIVSVHYLTVSMSLQSIWYCISSLFVSVDVSLINLVLYQYTI